MSLWMYYNTVSDCLTCYTQEKLIHLVKEFDVQIILKASLLMLLLVVWKRTINKRGLFTE